MSVLLDLREILRLFSGPPLLLLIHAPVPQFLCRVVHRFWKSVSQVKKILGDSDGAKKFIPCWGLLAIVLLVEEAFTYLDHSWHGQDLLAGWSDLCLNLNKLFSDVAKVR